MEGANFSNRKLCQNSDCCIVKNSKSKANKDLNISFHRFPPSNQRVVVKNAFGILEPIDRLKAWQNALKVRNTTNRMKVCSLHFDKDDYCFSGK